MKLKNNFNRLDSNQRLHKLNIPVIGLTGGIASGKSTVSKILKDKGLAIIDADLLVKGIYALPDTIQFIQKEFPDVVTNGIIQFPLLRKKVFSNREVKETVENFIYKRLFPAFNLAFNKLNNPEVLIYDIPLLFEKNMKDYFDLTVLVYAPQELQIERLMNRDGLSEELAKNILSQQMDIEDKKSKAEFIINNSGPEAKLTEEVNTFLRQILDN